MRQTVKCETATDRRADGMPEILREWLPPHMLGPLLRIGGRWEELHLRVGRACSVTVGGENRRVALSLREDEMEALVMRLCDGSLYAYRESLTEGYIALSGGIRVGLCGQAVPDGGRLLGVRAVDTLCIRFPYCPRGVGVGIASTLRRCFPRGGLIYAPPGQGKTTLLRSLAVSFAGGDAPLRVAVVDTRRELDDGSFGGALCLSLLSGYPKGQGIEIAARTMNAQLIMCDELGVSETASVVAAANCGVPVIASAHAATAAELLRRPGIRELHKAAVFGVYVGIRKRCGGGDFDYTVTPWEDAEC